MLMLMKTQAPSQMQLVVLNDHLKHYTKTNMPTPMINAAYVLTGFRQHFVNESRPATAEETQNGLPHSFRVLEHVCGGGRVYKTYHGPSGQKFRSIRQVTRANPSSPAE
jgi:hypothetical protein